MYAPDPAPADSRTDPVPAERVPKSVRRLACCRTGHGIRSADEPGAATPDDALELARRIERHDRVTEAVVLSTCNRTEVYCSTRTPADREAALCDARAALDASGTVRTETGLDVVEHLTRVACGLESRILGEDHILGQVRRTFEAALEAGLAGGVLTRAADTAVSVGRACRDETAINEGRVSYGSATCGILEDGGPPDRLVVVGAGEMATAVANAAARRWDARVDVVNRSDAPGLPTGDGRYWPLADLTSALSGADAVVTATGAPEPVVTPETAAGLEESALVVDLANPPDVADAVRESSVRVVDLDAVQDRIDDAVAGREEAVPAVEDAVADALESFVERERENRAEDTLRALHRSAASIRESELERARDRLENGSADPETVLEDFASALTGSLLGTPTERLRTAARDGDDAVIEATHRLFDLDTTLEGSRDS